MLANSFVKRAKNDHHHFWAAATNKLTFLTQRIEQSQLQRPILLRRLASPNRFLQPKRIKMPCADRH